METKVHERYYERLTSDNAALLLIDHQVGLLTRVRDIPVAELKHNVVALAKAAKVLGVPTIVTATSPEMWGPNLHRVLAVTGDDGPVNVDHRRTGTMNNPCSPLRKF